MTTAGMIPWFWTVYDSTNMQPVIISGYSEPKSDSTVKILYSIPSSFLTAHDLR